MIKEAKRLWGFSDDSREKRKAVALFKADFEENESTISAYRLGCAYYNGTGAGKDINLALKYFSHSSLEEYRYALFYKGLILGDRNFSGYNLEAAEEALKKAYSLGVDKAEAVLKSLRIFPRAKTELNTDCTICGTDLGPARSGEGLNCPGCGARPRTRTLPTLLKDIVLPLLPEYSISKELLAFSMTSAEEPALLDVFPNIYSASYAGKYRPIHEDGVDIRDMGRYNDDRFVGIFGLLIFDYFTEIDQALQECARVLESGGVLFTNIADYRLVEGDKPPVALRKIIPRQGYFNYFPKDFESVSIKVGKNWFLQAMRRAGFSARYVRLTDPATDIVTNWFVGVKGDGPALVSSDSERQWLQSLARKDNENIWPIQPPASAPTPINIEGVNPEPYKPSPTHEKSYHIPLPEGCGARSVSVALSIPPVSDSLKGCAFLEHVMDPKNFVPTDTVVVGRGGVLGVSEDLGKTWRNFNVPEAKGLRSRNSFTTLSNRHIVQFQSYEFQESPISENSGTQLFVFDTHWELLHHNKLGETNGYANRSIDQSGGTIMLGESLGGSHESFPDVESKTSDHLYKGRPARVLRSQDDGLTWLPVLTLEEDRFGQFQTVRADPVQVGVWYVSAQGQNQTPQIWRSDDDGDSWIDMTNHSPNVELPSADPQYLMSVQNFSDVVFDGEKMIWGSDNILGDPSQVDPDAPRAKRAGARLFMSLKSNPVEPREIGFIGHEIQKFVDVGRGWIVISAGTVPEFGLRPTVHLLMKKSYKLIKLFDVDNYADQSTGFMQSRGSHMAKNGVFFTYRNIRDVFSDVEAHLLRWDIAFN